MDEQNKAEDAKPSSLSFGFSKTINKRTVAVNLPEAREQRQLITGIQGSQFRALEPEVQEEKKVFIVPKLENTYKTGVGPKKFTPTFKPPVNDAPAGGSGDDRFELAAPTAPSVTGYGLEKRHRPEDAPAEGAGVNNDSIVQQLTADQKEENAYQRDMEQLPNEATLEDYESMPIEEFGMALLRGMGWKEGMGVGRNRKQVEPTEYIRRPERLGLGAKPAMNLHGNNSSKSKPGDKRAAVADMVLPPDADGRQRHVKTLDEKLVHRSELLPGPRAGKVMLVAGGRHEGLVCTVLSLLPPEEGRSDRASVRLQASNEVVEVGCKNLQDISKGGKAASQEPSSSGRPSEAQRSQQERDGDGRRRGHSPADNGRPSTSRGQDKYQDAPSSKKQRTSDPRDAPPPIKRTWLAPFIKVRVVDKKVRGGKMYLKKGTVMDVHPGALCDVRMDETKEMLQLHQDALETVVPKEEGAAVLVVAGKLRGNKARLLKSKTSSSEGAAAVQLVVDFSLHRLMLDEVAMYVGPMDDE